MKHPLVRTAFVALICVLSALPMSAQDCDYVPEYPPSGSGRYMLTPEPSPRPIINGPNVFGVRPGSSFLYTIPVSGERPMKFSASSLPEGITVDSDTGFISGTIADRSIANYQVTLNVENASGKASKDFTIKVGEEICLTPPLGWNSWNCWSRRVSQERVLRSARAMVSKGLNNYGFTYVNIDGNWQNNTRGGKFNALEPDPTRFPDIKDMFDEIHSLGLKGGIYSTPWVTSFAGGIGGSSDNEAGDGDKSMIDPRGTKLTNTIWRRVGKHSFAKNDVQQWAEWGVDYLKYDWNPHDEKSLVEMANELRASGRDIVYSLSNTVELSAVDLCKTHANCWRTGGDLKDRWISSTNYKGRGIVDAWKSHRDWQEKGWRGGPGHFPDADMMVVGDVNSSSKGPRLEPTNLTPDEQYTHVTLWTLWAAPILLGCPVENMDAFTLNLFTNAEVLDLHQDAAAVPGVTVYNEDGLEIIVKELADGSRAIGLFNRNEVQRVVPVDWEIVGLTGPKNIRDVWRHKDLGEFSGQFSAMVRPHGSLLLRVE